MVWAQQVTTTTTTTTVTVSDEDSANESLTTTSVNPLGLSNSQAIAAYNALLVRSEALGKVMISGKPAGTPAPDTCADKAPEMNYDKPDGFIVVSRSFIPINQAEEDVKTSAIRELPSDASKEEIDDMMELIRELRTIFQERCKSKHDLLLTTAIRNAAFPYNKHSRICSNNKEVYAAFQSQPPDLAFIEKIYTVFYEMPEKDGYRERLTYATMRDMKIWHCNDRSSALNKATSCFHSLAVDIVRNSRGKFSRKARLNHGVSVTISAAGGRKHVDRRDRKKGFIPEQYVKGWAEPKHKGFNTKYGFPEPLPLKDEAAVYRATCMEKTTYGLYAPSCKETKDKMTLAGHVAADDRTKVTDTNEQGAKVTANDCTEEEEAEGRQRVAVFLQRLKAGEKQPLNATMAPSRTGPGWSKTLRKQGLSVKAQVAEQLANIQIPVQKRSPLAKNRDHVNHIDEEEKSSAATAEAFQTLTADLEWEKYRARKERQNIKALTMELEKKEKEAKIREDNHAESLSKSLAKQVKAKEKSKKQKRKGTSTVKSNNKKTQQPKANGTKEDKESTTLLPWEQAPPDDHENNIVEIIGYAADPQGWWVSVVEGSRSGRYTERDSFLTVESTYDICQECVENGDEQKNFLVETIRNNPANVPYQVAKIVAEDRMESSVEEVFGCSLDKFKGMKRKQNGKRKHPKLVQDEVPKASRTKSQACSLDRGDPGNFKAVNESYYFLANRKYAALCCLGCRNPFATACNKEKDGYGNAIPLPTAKVAAHVCTNFEVDKCACGTILCSECYIAVIDAASTKRKRGGRDPKVDQKRTRR